MKWNLRHLRVFLEVARTHSVSGAAKMCNLSQPAATQAIAKLERELGQPLFRHTAQGLFPTRAGDMLAVRVRRALRRIDEAAAPIAPRLGASASFAQLEALIALREVENFTLAARHLGLSQPTVHRAVAYLESEARRPLFDRTAQGIRARRPARLLADAAQLAFAELGQGEMELAELAGRAAGRIVIGAMPLSRSSLLPRAITAFRRTRPDTLIRVDDGPYDDLLAGLRRGEIDFLVGALRDPLPINDVVQTPLFEDDLIAVVRPDHPLRQRATLTLDDLSEQPWVLARRGTPSRRIFDGLFEGRRTPDSIVETGSMILMRELLRSSDHVGFISRLQAAAEVDQGLMVPLDLPLPGTRRPIGLTTRSDWIPTAAQDALLHEINAPVGQK